MTDGWIVIPNWDKFQHYKNRQPVWIKVYTELAHDDDWLHLSDADRGLLVRIWIEYALSRRALPRAKVNSMVHHRRAKGALSTLQKAGFIEISASKPASTAASPEKRRKEKENPQPPSEKGAQDFSNDLQPGRRKPTAKELRRYTGCSYKRGTHGSTYVHEVLGTAKPPPDWPHPPPEPDEILLHLEIEDR